MKLIKAAQVDYDELCAEVRENYNPKAQNEL
ncbi:hypothetical protein CCACVL1_12149 [Corchorus capsularis]|uniref:Uncharacterized protein n=1 Tax=Corchorus capsularis TaxID=210143 RepID=A0A1R3IH71_COCAP|nr:hypothetical protein CCACVL1_12149 [Corchorus capsularis]